jgi:hypothetical protein
MANQIADMSPRQASLIAGFGLLAMSLLAPFAFYFVYQGVVVQGDAARTAGNVLANEMLFRFAIGGFVVVALLDVLVAWALYVLLKPVNENLSLLAAWFRVAYAAILGIASFNLLSVLRLLSGAGELAVIDAGQLDAQVVLLLNAFNDGWLVGLVFFGVHLLILGYLVYRSGFIPQILGVLLMLASVGYLADSFGKFLVPHYDANIAMFTFIGEVLFMLWLLFRGGRTGAT